jgi:hypothetical protein
MGFLFFFVISCRDQHSMEKTFPFIAYPQPEDDPRAPNRQYVIQALVGNLEDYGELFEEYGYGGNGASWAEHICFILEEKDPELLNHLDFDEEGDTFFVWLDGETSAERFFKVILPVFGNLATLEEYLKQADPDNFME